MGRALVLVLVVLLSAALIYMIAAPRLLPHTTPAVKSGGIDGQGTPSAAPSAPAPTSTAAPNAPIPVPISPQQQSRDTLESKREPYYRWIRDHEGAYLTDFHPSADDPATLCLYLSSSNEAWVRGLVADAIQPYASTYGFSHVLFFVPNAPGSLDRYLRDAEATPDSGGQWHAFFE